MITTMLLAKKLGATKSELLSYANSGDVTGDKSGVVGYMAAVLYNNPGNKSSKKSGIDRGLSDNDKETLHKIARSAIEAKWIKKKHPPIEITSNLDLDVEHKDGKLQVADVRIHKLNGKERYL